MIAYFYKGYGVYRNQDIPNVWDVTAGQRVANGFGRVLHTADTKKACYAWIDEQLLHLAKSEEVIDAKL